MKGLFPQQQNIRKVGHFDDLPKILLSLGFEAPLPVLVLSGGASGIQADHEKIVGQVVEQIAAAAEAAGSAVLDGGTRAGVMAQIGRARSQLGLRFPLVGVAVEQLATGAGPDGDRYDRLDPGHTHFLLVPGSRWGDESPWIAKAASILAANMPSITLLVNGGEVSREDIRCSLALGRGVVVIKGTGRLADELASDPRVAPRLTIFDPAANPTGLKNYLYALLTDF